MPIPLQITFHGFEKSEALSAVIRQHVEKLERFSSSVLSCQVIVEPSERHHHKGNRYRIHVHLQVPDGDIQAGHDTGPENTTHTDPYVAVRDVFAAVRRQLEDYVRERRGDIKTHVVPAHGRVARIFTAADYGVIQDPDGREIHFHRHSVVGRGFDSLKPGAQVSFVEVPGEEGPWASTVHILGKHHPVG